MSSREADALPAEIREKYDALMARFRGVKAHVVAQAFNALTPGINWRGCSKGHMAHVWAESRVHPRSRLAYRTLARFTLDEIATAVEAEATKAKRSSR